MAKFSKVYKETIDISPDVSLLPKLGQAGYSVGEAIAELVDNSIDARSDNKPVQIVVEINQNKRTITISDDGVGMDKEEASKALVLAHSKKEGKLGQFGLGLKTACESLGEKFIITTTQKGSDEEYVLEFDEKEWLKSGTWQNFEIHIKRGIGKNFSGTSVTIEKLRITLYPNLVTNIKKQLQERFAPFILNGEVRIKVNTQWLRSEDPEIVEETKTSIEILLSNGDLISGWAGILKVGSQEKSGFNMFKRRRLIKAHEKLGYAYHPSKMWIAGELHLDNIPVTHNKREFITENPLYVEFFEKFLNVLKPLLADAQKQHRELKIRDLSPEKKETLKDNLLRALNRIDAYKELAFPAKGKPAKRGGEDGDLFDQEKREKRVAEVREIAEPLNESAKNRTPQKTRPRKVRFITIAGEKYQFDWDWRDLDPTIVKESMLDKENNRIMIFLNADYPLINVIKDEVFYISLFVSEGIAEVFLRENDKKLSQVVSLRDSTLYELAKVITEDLEHEKRQKELRRLENQKAELEVKLKEREKELAF